MGSLCYNCGHNIYLKCLILSRQSSAKIRVDAQPMFILSSSPWRESSLALEVFSRDYGRLSLIARSARKRQSDLRGVLTPFVPLQAAWFGQNEHYTLHTAHWLGGWAQPTGQALMSAWYVNELLLKLTAREDAMPHLYQGLFEVMQALSHNQNTGQALRQFEWCVLQGLGVAPDLRLDEHEQVLDTHSQYWMRPEHAPFKIGSDARVSHMRDAVVVTGSTLLALQGLAPWSDIAHKEALRLNRSLIQFRLPQGVYSRNVLQQLQQWKQDLNLHL